MPTWNAHISLGDLWQRFREDPGQFDAIRDETVARLRASPVYDSDDHALVYLVGEIAKAANVSQFRYDWGQFLYWADDQRVWLCTVSDCEQCHPQPVGKETT